MVAPLGENITLTIAIVTGTPPISWLFKPMGKSTGVLPFNWLSKRVAGLLLIKPSTSPASLSKPVPVFFAKSLNSLNVSFLKTPGSVCVTMVPSKITLSVLIFILSKATFKLALPINGFQLMVPSPV